MTAASADFANAQYAPTHCVTLGSHLHPLFILDQCLHRVVKSETCSIGEAEDVGNIVFELHLMLWDDPDPTVVTVEPRAASLAKSE